MKKFIDSSLKDMQLDERKTIGYTFKALGAGFYGLQKGTNFKETITQVIMEAGDADRLVECRLLLFVIVVVIFLLSPAMPRCVEH